MVNKLSKANTRQLKPPPSFGFDEFGVFFGLGGGSGVFLSDMV
jgi:hypothetical protein